MFGSQRCFCSPLWPDFVRGFKWVELCPFTPHTLSNSKKKLCYLSTIYVSDTSNNLLYPNMFGSQSCFRSPLRSHSAYLGNETLKRFLYVATIIFIFSAIIDGVFVVATNIAVRLFILLLFAAFLTYSTANGSNLFDKAGEFRLDWFVIKYQTNAVSRHTVPYTLCYTTYSKNIESLTVKMLYCRSVFFM
jgi:hypothetical protein